MTTDSRLTIHQPHSLSTDLHAVGQQADAAASRHIFEDYRSRKSPATRESQAYDLLAFERFLADALATPVTGLVSDPECWRGITWGIVRTFVVWQIDAGFAIGTINRRLSTIKTYAKLAAQAGALTPDALVLIRSVQGYGHKEGQRVNAARKQTRVGTKKAESVSLTLAQVRALKHGQPDTPQGRRDAFLMCLLLDHGLRVGEAAILKVSDFQEDGFMVFYRPKVDKVQRHKLTDDTYAALQLYLQDAPKETDVPILMTSRKSGALDYEGVTRYGLNKRVGQLGQRVGIPNLGPHDLRHSWATRAARNGTDPFALQEAGGWNSLTMPRRYIELAEVANQGVKLE
jgi:integrase